MRTVASLPALLLVFAAACAAAQDGTAPPVAPPVAPPAAPPAEPAPPPVPGTAPAAAPAIAPLASAMSLSGVWILDRRASDDPARAFAEIFRRLPPPAQGRRGAGGGPGARPGGGRGGIGDAGGMGGMGGMGGPGGSSGRVPGGARGGATGLPGGATGGDIYGDASSRAGSMRFGGEGNADSLAARRDELAAGLAAGWERLLITDDGAEIEILDARDRARRYAPGGAAPASAAPAGAAPAGAPDGPGRGSGPFGAEVARWEGGRLVVESRADDGPSLVTTYERDARSGRLFVTIRIVAPRAGVERTLRLVYDPA